MIELKIKEGEYSNTLLISKDNNILYFNKQKILQFIKVFYDTLDKKEELYFSNNLVNNKEYKIINLLDIASILDNLKLIKNSILTDYLEIFILNDDNNYQEKAEELLTSMFKNIISSTDLNFSYETNTTISKLINNNLNVELNYKINEIQEILEIILNKITEYNYTKTYIIFIDRNLIDINIKSDNVYYFNINSNTMINDYNLLFLNEFRNFNYEVLLNEIKYNWPLNYEITNIEYYLKVYLRYYLSNKNIISSNIYIKNISNIMNKLYNINQICNNDPNLVEIL